MASIQSYTSKNLDHLGLVASMCDELGIVNLIDTLIPQDHSQRIVSIGQAVKAMIINGLGFVNRSLYLTPHFFEDKPIERLIGPNIQASHLNDDVLGRALDSIYAYDPTQLYTHCAAKAVTHLGLTCTTGHLDSTSLHVDGQYNSNADQQEGVVRLTKGYSRDHRPDLNQIVLQFICDHQAGIPLLMEALNGNNSDKDSFRNTINTHIEQMQHDFGLQYIIADSALYTAETLRDMQGIKWITRVPENITLAQDIIRATAPDLMGDLHNTSYCSLSTTYGDVRQRWVVIYSPDAYHRACKTVDKKQRQKSDEEAREFVSLCKQEFACEADAKQALAKFTEKLKATCVSEDKIIEHKRFHGKGRPAKGREPDFQVYCITGFIEPDVTVNTEMLQRKSCFILATNELDCDPLSEKELLSKYKDQQKVERGFRFLKDPLFMASTIFLKSPERIMALMMIMTLCLLVYAALEYRIREALRQHDTAFPDQKGKPTANPTARWVFQAFSGIHLLVVGGVQELILNIKEYHFALIAVLGSSYQKIYANSG